MSATNPLVRLRYRFFPDHVIGEILSKRWSDNAIPFAALVVALVVFGSVNPRMFTAFGLYDIAGQLAEFGLVAIALSLVMISGGIDLSIGSVFALCALTVLTALNVYGLPLSAAAALTLGVGAACGAINGFLIGVLRLRAFLTTLVTLVMFRSVYEMVLPGFATQIVLGMPDSPVWDALGFEALLGLPYTFYISAALAVVWHIVLSRSRPGWHIAAVGGARRSAYNAGIPVRRVLLLTYVSCSMMVAVAAILFGARMTSVGLDTGLGMEISVLTAVILGGTTLGGGRGSVAKALIGSVIVLILTNGLLQLGVIGTVSSLILGVVLLAAVWLDVRWVKNRQKLIDSSYVSPAYIRLADTLDAEDGTAGVFAVNDRLRTVETIGLGEVEGPEDVAVDRAGNVYSGSRHGEIHRWLAPDFRTHEIFAHIGGGTFGMNFDRDDNLVVCVGGMGLYMVTPAREVVKLTDEITRSWNSVIDDSRIRLADDLDIAPDGRIFFSEASIRYTVHDWPVDMIESRGNGRIICYDPRDGSTRTVLRNRIFPNGIVCLPDGQSLLFNETWACRVCRYWFDGPRKGQVEIVLDGLPGYPDNINRASDGNYWVCLVGMRGPVLDMAMTRPGFRRRMTRRIAPANWLYPNINTGCVIKITPDGEVLESLWDRGGVNHPMVTSCKEHEGHLYIGGVSNNRVGRWKIPGADPTWSSPVDYWGERP
ncbi:ABC transporter permease [Celeribacter indicus]|uniref:ABC transporter n=1 Tax=Celeribacter indicus TaxID=1208324 RepID=A0A0B5E7V4_9RHOB|nr:SMP-30/gluconolactonase/LRE family protein [Celeribacter indicus]AJE49126.1 ABC transporter [Celeribacter indicus]SDX17087.1 ribose transport system permease protein [Celeribacter indicus]